MPLCAAGLVSIALPAAGLPHLHTINLERCYSLTGVCCSLAKQCLARSAAPGGAHVAAHARADSALVAIASACPALLELNLECCEQISDTSLRHVADLASLLPGRSGLAGLPLLQRLNLRGEALSCAQGTRQKAGATATATRASPYAPDRDARLAFSSLPPIRVARAQAAPRSAAPGWRRWRARARSWRAWCSGWRAAARVAA